MRRTIVLVGMLLIGYPVFAQAKAVAQYQDAVMVGFKMVSTGTDCSSNGTVSGKVQNNGQVNGTTSSTSSCSDSAIREYTIQVAGNTFLLRPTLSGKRKAGEAALVIGTLGYGALFLRTKDILANQLPGARILIMSQGSGFQIKVGKKDSLYSVAGAH